MNNIHSWVLLIKLFAIWAAVKSSDVDLPCAARLIENQSVVCVCNATYCDTISRDEPSIGTYVAYTSSEAGRRFDKSYGNIEEYSASRFTKSTPILELNAEVKYQEISGFGGAVTDSAGINWLSLEDTHARQNLIDSYFSKNGIEYSMMRVPIGGTDFSVRAYAYQDDDSDVSMQSFTLAPEDYEYKIPMIEACMEAAEESIRIVASLWSPPTWMKTTNNFTSGHLKEEYYQTLADYFLKFLESYHNNGISIWGVTTTNEPSGGVSVPASLNRLEWNIVDMGEWIANNLGPTIRNSSFSHVKILTGDDQRSMVPLWFNFLIATVPAALDFIDGVAVHFYFDKYTPATQLTQAFEDYPDKFLLYTEACSGVSASSDEKVLLGSWDRAEDYAFNILENLNHGAIGWLDWNMCLDVAGGPTWLQSGIDSPIIVSSTNQEFYKQPMFYALGHFSKFLPRGTRRIQVEETSGSTSISYAAFLTPEETVVVVLLNQEEVSQPIVLRFGQQAVSVTLAARSISTVELQPIETENDIFK